MVALNAQQVNHACITLQLTRPSPANAMLHTLVGVTAGVCVLGIKNLLFRAAYDRRLPPSKIPNKVRREGPVVACKNHHYA